MLARKSVIALSMVGFSYCSLSIRPICLKTDVLTQDWKAAIGGAFPGMEYMHAPVCFLGVELFWRPRNGTNHGTWASLLQFTSLNLTRLI